MQILTTRFGAPDFTDQGKVQLRVSHGNLQYLKKGDTLQAHIVNIIQGRAEANIQGQHVTLEGLSKHLQGETITLKVIKEGKHPRLELQTQTPRSPSPSMGKSALPAVPAFTLPVGKIIAATVEQRLNPGHMILQWRDQRFEAPAPAHIQTGDLLLLQVTKGGKIPEFYVLNHLAQAEPEITAPVRHQKNSGPELQKSLKYRNLKTIMFDLAGGRRQKKITSETAKTTHASGQAAARIESPQVLNLIASMQADPARLELPVLIGGQQTSAYLSVQQEQRENHGHGKNDAKKKQSYNILFALDLAKLGTLRIDARISPESVYANFYHGNDTARQFVQHNIRRLEGKLRSLGYQGIYLGTAPGKQISHEKTVQFEQLINDIPGSSDGLLDITG